MAKYNLRTNWRLLLLCLLAITAMACSETDNDTTATPTNDSSNPIKVSVGMAIALKAEDTENINSIIYLDIQWTIVSKPPNSLATIENADSATPTFRPDIVGEYVLRVVITQNGSVLADNEIKIVAGLDDLFPPMPATHILTTDICEACHDTITWSLLTVDHNQVIGSCISCHDGVTASGKGPNHIPTTDQCDACHAPGPIPWAPLAASTVDHTQVVGTCFSCHNGVIATGKGPLHVVTSEECDICHTTIAWLMNSVIDHSTFAGNCISCHDGVQASGKTSTHILTSDQCDACHAKAPAQWVPLPASTVDHTEVIGTCSSCHDGVIATGKGPNHIPTTEQCDACHAPAPMPWAPLPASTVDHSQVVGVCSSCHNGVIATGKGPLHIATNEECDVCHTTIAWVESTVVDHTGFAGNCINCHDGVQASGKGPNHIPTTDQCDACHATAPAPWAPLPVMAIDHTEVVGTCVSCHNGVLATGKSVSHITSTDQCEACHLVAGWISTFGNPVDHTQVLGTCESCHNGVVASGKPATHIETNLSCDQCHDTLKWVPVLN